MQSHAEVQPFRSKEIARPFDLKLNQQDDWEGFQIRTDHDTKLLHLLEDPRLDLDELKNSILHLNLHDKDLDSLDQADTFVSLHGLHAVETSPHDSQVDDDDEEDFWNTKVVLGRIATSIARNWDSFENDTKLQHAQIYLSETTPEVYDALVSDHWLSTQSRRLRYVDADQFQHSIRNLIFGRASSIFIWDKAAAVFHVRDDKMTLTSLTPALAEATLNGFIRYGTMVRQLRDFSQRQVTFPTATALQASISVILQGLEHHISADFASSTLPELYVLIQSCSDLLQIFVQLIDYLEACNSEVEVVTRIVRCLESAWYSDLRWRSIFMEVLAATTGPAMQQIVKVLEVFTVPDNVLTSDLLLWHLLPKMHSTLDEIHQYSQYMDRDISTRLVNDNSRHLSLAAKWTVLHDPFHCFERPVETLPEVQLLGDTKMACTLPRATITREPRLNHPFDVDFNLVTEQNGGSLGTQKHAKLAQILMSSMRQPDSSADMLELSPLQAIEFTAAPMIESWHQRLSEVLMHKLLVEHKLQSYTQKLAAHYLLDDGWFANRLSRALFAQHANAITSDRHVDGRSGLAVDFRSSWPPSDTEVRLSIMGVLTSQWESAGLHKAKDCLSFAFRELSAEQAQACHNQQSLHSLDFLRLVCNPPSSILDLVVDAASLEKYESIFHFLLIMLRVHSLALQRHTNSVTNDNMHKDIHAGSAEFGLMFLHLTSTLVDFVLKKAVGLPLTKWSQYLGEVQEAYDNDASTGNPPLITSPAELRVSHTAMLDAITTTLMLDARQAKAQNLLREILSLFLQKAHSMRSTNHSEVDREFCIQLKLKIGAWLEQIHDLCKSDDPALQRLEMLYISMTISDYYVND